MKRFLILLSVFLVSWTSIELKGQDTLLLFHPTAGNLEVFQQLMTQQILELKGIHILGVYHQKESYDYSESDTFLTQHPGLPVSLLKVQGNLAPGQLFRENECTPIFARLFRGSVGAFFMGGPDIPPSIYNEPHHLLTVVTDPFRHYMEASYLFHLLGGNQDPGWIPWMEQNEYYLVSGICLGMQTLNVATGGTLVQDIPTEMYHLWQVEDLLALPPDQVHSNYEGMLNAECEEPTSYHFHAIHINSGGFLSEGHGLEGTEPPMVLSSHHQCVELLGKGLYVSATSMDGKVIEAVQHIRYPYVFGVQFHPEKPGLFDPAVLHSTGCNTSASFKEAIEGTSSYGFHLAYWDRIGNLLQGLKQEK
jgi:putative glutamine amidotransferase